jgi:16S rRNA (adenine1518-N6/adenine1519-N6)-dimethyltransferase
LTRRNSTSHSYPPTLKRLGQHFLADERIVDRIADALEITASDTVIEIGPGRGVLTDRLIARAGRVIAVELDRALAAMLRDRYATQQHVTIVERDILDVSLGELGGPDYLVAGNVPYYITTPILFHALRAPMPRRAVYLVQREVAERAVAPPGNKTYGALSVNLQCVATVEHLFNVPAGAFRPPPKVESAVMRVTPLVEPLIDAGSRDKFQTFVQGMFGLRRKQLGRVLRTLLALDAESVESLLQRLAFDPSARPETLAPADFARLFRAVRERER